MKQLQGPEASSLEKQTILAKQMESADCVPILNYRSTAHNMQILDRSGDEVATTSDILASSEIAEKPGEEKRAAPNFDFGVHK